MPYKNLREFISALEQAGELVRIKEYVNPHLEITEITDRISKANGPALLFENTGTDFPLLINAMGSEKRMSMALGVKRLDDIAAEITELFKTMTAPKNSMMDKLKMLPLLGNISTWMPKIISGKGACQQVVMPKPDVTKLPVMKCWPEDGGPFITLPVIQTQDPNTGIRNVGLYRMQVFGPELTAMHWHRHKVSARHFMEYKKLSKRMPVVISLGGDPVYTYCGTAPLPDGVDEFMLAGFIRKKPVELVKCLTQDMYVPADADLIIEGYIDPNEEFILEGPFGDHTGYYSLADYYPKFHITCITHRKDAIYPSTIVGIPPQEDAWIGKATERIFLAPIKMMMVPEVVDMVLPVEGVFHNLAIVKINKEFPGQAVKVMHSLWGAGQMMFTKMMIIVDGNVNIHNNEEVAKYISRNADAGFDFHFTQGPADVLDHSCSAMAFGGKLGIDATQKLPEELWGRNASEEKPKIESAVIQKEITSSFPEIKSLNASLVQMEIPIVFVTIQKNRKNHVRELANAVFRLPSMRGIKILICLEPETELTFIADAVWRFANNLDPKRDSIFIAATTTDEVNHLAFDATRKTKEHDGFERDWPNILVSDDATIKRIDLLWNTLGLGKLIASPSLRYKKQAYQGGAVAE
ncbi:MAG: menaquinone biosynthesis decarboxylase [Bacteroidia bacterium]|nr:menaquinone biosynthesis decarboxylase [Bacteroidia bacterium]